MIRPTPPTYKTKNLSAYNEALKRRVSLTIWFDAKHELWSSAVGQTWPLADLQ